MSSATTTPRQVPTTFHCDSQGIPCVGSASPLSRPAGKGRRRRAAAEQRLLEQQQWVELGDQLSDLQQQPYQSPDAASSSYEGPKLPGSRRQQRKASRRALAAAEAAARREEIDEFFSFSFSRSGQSHSLPNSSGRTRPTQRTANLFSSSAEQEQFELALAVSLSLSDSGSESSARAIQRTLQGDLSYENLVNLEDVSRALKPEALETLGTTKLIESNCDEVCPICLDELVEADSAVVLPCQHMFHESCGSEWLLHYSRRCPVCKEEVAREIDQGGED